jgi:F0F1-type ATP synthase membrane subunit c/vacuolar-type H+-ATPase subunit K
MANSTPWTESSGSGGSLVEVVGSAWSLGMSIVKNRSTARRVDSVAQNERMFSVTCICVEILVGALAIYALWVAILVQAPAASPPQSKASAEMSFVGP